VAKAAQAGAQVEVSNAMFLTGRGAVVLGHVRAGSVRVGQLSAPLALGGKAAQRLEVSAIERLSSMDGGAQAVGIAFRNAPELGELKRCLPVGSLLLLEDPAADTP
jgi:translation elongation factor EF-Tu-like GTPase